MGQSRGQVGSREEAVAAAGAGCDMVVAQGVEAGGHIRGRIGLGALLPEVLESVDIPVVAAGGIGSGRGMAAALAAGAAGVRIGTQFAAAVESGAHPFYVDALIAARAEETVVTETFSLTWQKAPHRVLQSCVAAVLAHSAGTVGEMVVDGRRTPIRRFAGTEPTKEASGAIEAMPLYAGESVSYVRRLQPAAAILQELADEAGNRLADMIRVTRN